LGKEVKNMSMNISSFISNSLKNSYTSSSGLSSSFYSIAADYTKVKSKSYRTILKAYYKLQDSDKSSSSSNSTISNLVNKTSSSTYSNVKTNTDKLTSSAEKLYATDSKSLFKTDENSEETAVTDDIVSAVKSFADNYNSVLSSIDKTSNTTLNAKKNFMVNQTNIYADKLSEVGITIDANSKLTVDEEKLSSADFEKVKTLFNGTSSFAYKVAQNSDYVGQAAVSAATISGSTYSYNWYI
jgi:hypothetical protein